MDTYMSITIIGQILKTDLTLVDDRGYVDGCMKRTVGRRSADASIRCLLC